MSRVGKVKHLIVINHMCSDFYQLKSNNSHTISKYVGQKTKM